MIKANYLHNSSHVAGTVNFVGTITCTAAVSNLALTTTLYDTTNGRSKKGYGPYSPGGSSIQANSALACRNGQYYGHSQGDVTFPPGFTPATATISATSPASPSPATSTESPRMPGRWHRMPSAEGEGELGSCRATRCQ